MTWYTLKEHDAHRFEFKDVVTGVRFVKHLKNRQQAKRLIEILTRIDCWLKYLTDKSKKKGTHHYDC